MQITRAADIALRTLMALATQPQRRATVAQLSTQLCVPERHLGKTVQRLASAGWIQTSRGRGGGLQISDAGCAATAADVLREMEDARPVVNCTEPPCPLACTDCQLRHLLLDAQAAFMAQLATVRIGDAGRVQAGIAPGKEPCG